ncbi:RHS repeat-associated core domain-containing protein, partial [Neisseria sp. P0014.S002]
LAYDELDRLIGETTVHNGQSATVGYRYDPLGNRIRTILPDGRPIDYLYYGSGHLHQISLDGEVITDIERDKLHREIQRTQGSISSLYDYDPMGRLKSQRTVWSGTPTLRGKQNLLAGGAVNRRYAYDKAGNLIQSANQRSGVLNYVYDKIGRIQEARNSQTDRSETFTFDPAHNILSDKAAEGKGKGSNLVSGNRLKEYNGIEYTYDALGNLIYRQLPDGENQYYQYDLENQLVRAEIKKPAGNTEIWEYAYDPFGRRLSKERKDKLAWTSTDPKRTHFVWDGTRLLQEYTYKGSYTYIYTDQDSYEPLAQIFDNAKDGKQYIAYFHNDQIGIPREMTDIHGNLLWYGEYTAWGRLKKDERVYRNAHQPFRLQNQYFDEETGLHYNLMRYYEPEAGRFMNQDPIGLLGGDNLYLFAPNMQTWIDSLGLSGKLTIYSDTHDFVGHAFIGLEKNGRTQYIGQWPGGEGFRYNSKDITSILVSDMGGTMSFNDTRYLDSKYLVSRSYDLNDDQMKKVESYIRDFNNKNTETSGYNLRNRQCASFAYGASQAADIKEMKMSGWVTPASLAKKINKLNGK